MHISINILRRAATVQSIHAGLLHSCAAIVTTALLTMTASTARADKLYQYAMYATTHKGSDTCELKPRLSIYSGRLQTFTGTHHDQACWVSMDKKRYNALFRFCYMSGFNIHNAAAGQSVECFIQERDKDYAFSAYIEQNNRQDSQIMCYFTCIGKDNKNSLIK